MVARRSSHSTAERSLRVFSSSCFSSRRWCFRASRVAKRSSVRSSGRPSTVQSSTYCSCLFAAMLSAPDAVSKVPDGAEVTFSLPMARRIAAADGGIRHHPTHRRDRGLQHRHVEVAAGDRCGALHQRGRDRERRRVSPSVSAIGNPVRVGAVSGIPVTLMMPDNPWMIWSYAGRPRIGPVCPNPETAQYTSPSFSASAFPRRSRGGRARRGGSSPAGRRLRGPGARTPLCRRRVFRSRVSERFAAFWARNEIPSRPGSAGVRTEVPGEVADRRCLDLDHVRAHQRQLVPGERSRQHVGQVEHLHPGQQIGVRLRNVRH